MATETQTITIQVTLGRITKTLDAQVIPGRGMVYLGCDPGVCYKARTGTKLHFGSAHAIKRGDRWIVLNSVFHNIQMAPVCWSDDPQVKMTDRGRWGC